jgi:DNA-binding transcriptional ArsR family regulator
VAVLLTLLGGERRVSDLVEAVGGSQSNVSGHLACLRDCGLVVDRPGERRQVFYRLAGPEVVELLQAAERLLAATGTRIELCQNPLMRQASDHHG